MDHSIYRENGEMLYERTYQRVVLEDETPAALLVQEQLDADYEVFASAYSREDRAELETWVPEGVQMTETGTTLVLN